MEFPPFLWFPETEDSEYCWTTLEAIEEHEIDDTPDAAGISGVYDIVFSSSLESVIFWSFI